MKRKRLLVMMLILSVIVLSACGSEKPEADNTSAEPDQRRASFVGEWRCGETLLETDEYYSGYLALRVEEDGEFSMYDVEAGNPGISGHMEYSSDHEVMLKCGKDDFDPPPGWGKMDYNQSIEYKFVSENELQLAYVGNEGRFTLVFTKE